MINKCLRQSSLWYFGQHPRDSVLHIQAWKWKAWILIVSIYYASPGMAQQNQGVSDVVALEVDIGRKVGEM